MYLYATGDILWDIHAHQRQIGDFQENTTHLCIKHKNWCLSSVYPETYGPFKALILCLTFPNWCPWLPGNTFTHTYSPCPSLYTCKHAFFFTVKKWVHILSWKIFANGNSGKISITCSCKADSIFKLKYVYTNKYLKRNYFHPNMHPHTDNKLSVHELGSHTQTDTHALDTCKKCSMGLGSLYWLLKNLGSLFEDNFLRQLIFFSCHKSTTSICI